MMRVRNDSLIFDGNDLVALLDRHDVEIPDDADVQVALSNGESLQFIDAEDVCLIVRVTREDSTAENPDILPMLPLADAS
ncbi:MAG TPA: hypothetical protein VHD36_12435 [Pirellulales bacterium]|nr:hypothetical protein [Pirellulales bacterium]